MKNTLEVCFITISLMLTTSCADVTKSFGNRTPSSDGSSTYNSSYIPSYIVCSDFNNAQVRCEAQKPKCEYYDGKCDTPTGIAVLKGFKRGDDLIASLKAHNKQEIPKKVDAAKPFVAQNKAANQTEPAKTVPTTLISKEIKDSKDLEAMSEEEFSQISKIILPESDPLVKELDKQLKENPFASSASKMTLVRPFVRGKAATKEKTENGKVVIKFDAGDAVKKVMTEGQLRALFGEFKNPQNLLGSGGVGSVYKVSTMDGFSPKTYALKINAGEFSDLEKLQSTGAVAKVFGAFTYDNKPCMLMELGQKSLADMNDAGEKLTDEQTLTTITNCKKLLEEQKKLNIENNDIKPANLLLTKDGKLVVIDIASGWVCSDGYQGSPSQLLARSLIENRLGKSFRGGYHKLHEIFALSKEAIEVHTISAENLVYWNKIVCSKVCSKGNCKDIKNFAEFFKLISQNKLYEIALETNKTFNDLTGTMDQTSYGLYKTGLSLPLIQELKNSEWENYYKEENRDKVTNGFCSRINSRNDNIVSAPVYEHLKEKYQNMCEESGKDKNGKTIYKLTKEFQSSKDEEFRQFIEDAFYLNIYQKTFEALGRKYPYHVVLEEIIELSLEKAKPVNEKVNKALLELYKLEPYQP